MKFYLLPVWILLTLAGSLSTVLPVSAQQSGSHVPQITAATGKTQPIGTRVDLTWAGIPGARAYHVYRNSQLIATAPQNGWTDYAVVGGQTYPYTVSSLGSWGESTQSQPATVQVPGGGGQVVYVDTLQNSWQSWSWATTSWNNSAPALNHHSVRVSAGPWQAMYLHHVAFDTTPFTALTFWVNGGATGGQSFSVSATRNTVAQTPVKLDPLPAGTWRQVTIPLSALGVAHVPNMDGFWIQDNTGTRQPTFYLDDLCLSSAAVGSNPPPAPSNLTVIPQWVAHCATCGTAMPHMILTWNAASGATSYTVCRNGAPIQANLTTTGWTDMSVTSGQTYTYTTFATGPGGQSPPSAAVSVTAPQPPAGALTTPTNLSVQGTWLVGSTDILSWSPAPGAASYNVYQYGVKIASGLTQTTFTVPVGVYYYGLTYAVTAVDSMGMETLPSAITFAQGQYDPAQVPGWEPAAPQAPTKLAATPEWNAGAPRIHVFWQGWDTSYTYNIYKDGQKVAGGLWGLNYYDNAVQPGETHTYTVSGVNLPWTTPVESAQSSAVTATALSSAPASLSTPVTITGVQANDDSALVSFTAVPGAVDYRVYSTASPNTVKYSGGGLSIEMNGLDPVAGANLVVEAVDKLGPFQTMDGMAGPGAMQMDGMHSAVNGQGDPSDVPNLLASSAPFHVTMQPVALTGSQLFFDNCRNENPLTLSPLPSAPLGDYYGLANQYAEYANDKWAIRNYGGDITDSAVFFMGNHFMDTLYDGGTPHTSDPMHNNNASLVLMPKTTADISGGNVLHVTFEVDSHFDSRRWCDLLVAPAADTLINPGKLDTGKLPTTSGNMFRWQITSTFHFPSIFLGGVETSLVNVANGINSDAPNVERDVVWHSANGSGWTTVGNNGAMQDLDKRHKFDLYLSQTHYRLMENGVLIKDADFPAGQGLPFSSCQVYFVHEVYHTANDRREQVDYSPQSTYWYNNRPWCDERHWDNLGEEVLTAFP